MPKLIHFQTRKVIASEIRVADRFLTRLRGLLFTQQLEKGRGLWLKPCQSVHTFGMQYAIDLIFLNRKNQTVKLVNHLKPNRTMAGGSEAWSAIEIPAGTLNEIKIAVGDTVILLEK